MDEERQAIIGIALKIEPGFRLPMVAHLMSLISSRINKQSVLEIFRLPAFKESPRHILSPRSTVSLDHGMLEVKQAKQIISFAYADRIDQQLVKLAETLKIIELDMRCVTAEMLGFTKEDVRDVDDGAKRLDRLHGRIATIMTLCGTISDSRNTDV